MSLTPLNQVRNWKDRIGQTFESAFIHVNNTAVKETKVPRAHRRDRNSHLLARLSHFFPQMATNFFSSKSGPKTVKSTVDPTLQPWIEK